MKENFVSQIEQFNFLLGGNIFQFVSVPMVLLLLCNNAFNDMGILIYPG